MKSYRPGLVKDADLRRELLSIVQAAQRAEPFLFLQVLYAEPAKPQPGMTVYADGTEWDPGSGEGVYARDKSNTNWRFLG